MSIKIAKKVLVNFFHPSTGAVTEEYDTFNPHDIACWRANNKLSALIQTGVKILEEVESTPKLVKEQEMVRLKADEIFDGLRKNKEEV